MPLQYHGQTSSHTYSPIYSHIAVSTKQRLEQEPGVMVAPIRPNQVWFPQLLRQSEDLPVLLPPVVDIVTGPEGLQLLSSNSRTSTSSRLAHLRRSYTAEGLSHKVIEMVSKSWRSSTESAYSLAWRQWDCWCTEQNINPIP